MEKKKPPPPKYKMYEIHTIGETIVFRDICSDGMTIGKGNYHEIWSND
jgi:hypothetical protein